MDGKLDLTYRCNNTCRHCWLWLPPGAPKAREELSLDDLRRVVDEARRMGCHAWAISGGEPMLRPDFPEIFDYITRKAVHYSLNTNGTLITPEIARLLARKGRKMVALYGATAEVHDRVTRNPGSFEATMRGFAYLREAGVGFEVQIIPMRENYGQYADMLALAASLSPDYRVGAAWLFLSACGSPARNREIARQRLEPAEVLVLDQPVPAVDLMDALTRSKTASGAALCGAPQADDRLFASCIPARRDFHIDPYGGMSFCYFVKDPNMRFDLRRGSFREAWDDFIPGLAETVRGGQEYLENCGSCELRRDCRWCAVYGYLEHRRLSAKVDYLCRVAQKARRFKEDWQLEHLSYYQIAGITIQVAADFPITDHTFHPKFAQFRVDGPGDDTVFIRHVSPVPALSDLKLGPAVYRRAPWAIYRSSRAWVYVGISDNDIGNDEHTVSIFSEDYSRATIYSPHPLPPQGQIGSLTAFSSDQIVLGRLLADRQAFFVHAGGIILDGKGLLFVGHSEAGKSTTLEMLRGHGEILCDDRIIVRRWPEGFRIHGTWSHGDLPDVSPAGAPLAAIMFLEKADGNELIPITDKRERLGRALSHLVKPLVDAGWWEKTLDVVGKMVAEVPTYRLRLDKSSGFIDLLRQL